MINLAKYFSITSYKHKSILADNSIIFTKSNNNKTWQAQILIN